MRRLAAAATAAVLAGTGISTASPASADATYRTQHIALQAVGSAPLRTGFVQNIHANGPVNYAMERYVLVGAEPRTTYSVTLQLFQDVSCATAIGPFPSVSFTTNGVGNGVGKLRLPPSAIPQAFRGLTIGVIWQLSIGGTVTYQTACSTVRLD